MQRYETLTRYRLAALMTGFATAPTGQPTGTEGGGEHGEGQQGQGQPQGQGNPEGDKKTDEKPLTPEEQARVDAAVEAKIEERLGRAKSAWAKDEAEKKKRDTMDAAERANAEKADIERERDEARRERDEARWEAQIAAHVSDSETALLIIKSAPDKYVGSDGKVKVEDLLRDKPILKRVKDQTGPGTGGRSGGQGSGDPLSSLDAALAADRASGRRK